jgi:hypothetical protein
MSRRQFMKFSVGTVRAMGHYPWLVLLSRRVHALTLLRWIA